MIMTVARRLSETIDLIEALINVIGTLAANLSEDLADNLQRKTINSSGRTIKLIQQVVEQFQAHLVVRFDHYKVITKLS